MIVINVNFCVLDHFGIYAIVRKCYKLHPFINPVISAKQACHIYQLSSPSFPHAETHANDRNGVVKL